MTHVEIGQLWQLMQDCKDKQTSDHLFAAIKRQFDLLEESVYPVLHPWTNDNFFSREVREAGDRLWKELIAQYGKVIKLHYQKIALIKSIRTYSSCGLVDGKNFVEKYFSQWLDYP